MGEGWPDREHDHSTPVTFALDKLKRRVARELVVKPVLDLFVTALKRAVVELSPHDLMRCVVDSPYHVRTRRLAMRGRVRECANVATNHLGVFVVGLELHPLELGGGFRKLANEQSGIFHQGSSFAAYFHSLKSATFARVRGDLL